jgi:hypothetical protein
MIPNEKDKMHELFSGMRDEPLPLNFNEKVMSRICREALRCEKRNKWLEISGYVSGAVAMIAVCVFIFYRMGISIEFPAFELPAGSFFQSGFSIFKSQSFALSIFVGILALFLLIIDSFIRRHIESKHK